MVIIYLLLILTFQELSEYIGLAKLNERIRDATLQSAFDGLFPRDDPANTRFSINFFTNIGLGGLTEDLRNHLKSNPKPIARVAPIIKNEGKNANSESSSSSSSSTSDDSEDEKEKKRKRKERKRKKKQKKRKKNKKSRKNSSEEEIDEATDSKRHSKQVEHNVKSPKQSEEYMNLMMEKMRTQKDRKERDFDQSEKSHNRREERKTEERSRDYKYNGNHTKTKLDRSDSRDEKHRFQKEVPSSEDENYSKSHRYSRDRSNASRTDGQKLYASERRRSQDRDESKLRSSRGSQRTATRRDDSGQDRKFRNVDRSRSRERVKYKQSHDEDRRYAGKSKREISSDEDETYSRTQKVNKSIRNTSRERQRRYSGSRKRRSRSRESHTRRRHSNERRDSSTSGEDQGASRRTKDNRAVDKRRDKESRWAAKEKEWKDPLLPKSNTVYKDALKGMLELLKQDADIKRQKELADNPEKARLAREQVGKMEKAAIKKPSENRPGDWKCTKKDCGNINFAWRKACNNCDTDRPDNAPDYKVEEEQHENADWFVGSIKTEEKSPQTNNQRRRRNSSPRALDEQSSSEEEKSKFRDVSSNRDNDRQRDRVDERNIRDKRYRDRSLSRERERNTYRKAHR